METVEEIINNSIKKIKVDKYYSDQPPIEDESEEYEEVPPLDK